MMRDIQQTALLGGSWQSAGLRPLGDHQDSHVLRRKNPTPHGATAHEAVLPTGTRGHLRDRQTRCMLGHGDICRIQLTCER